jgi:hypothetical protein
MLPVSCNCIGCATWLLPVEKHWVPERCGPVAGHIKWTREVRSYTGVQGVSRSSPAVEGDILVIGTLHSTTNLIYLPNSTFILAVNATTGDLLWKTMVEAHPLAGITMSPTIYNGGSTRLPCLNDCCPSLILIVKVSSRYRNYLIIVIIINFLCHQVF